MRKMLLIAGALASIALAAGSAGAHGGNQAHEPSAYCDRHATSGSEVAQDQLLIDSAGSVVAVCITEGPVKGAVVLKRTGANEGFVMIDGDGTNAVNPTDGHAVIQLSDDQDKAGFVGSCGGNYDHNNTLDTPENPDPNDLQSECQPG